MDITLESYIKTLNEIEMKVFKIASSHLESSFSLEKSIGYQEWKLKKEKELKDEKK
jgi:hypothetical protein